MHGNHVFAHRDQQTTEAEREERARERRHRIIQIEEQRLKNPQMSHLDQEDLNRTNSVLRKAKQALDEEMDEIKKINQMISFAKVQTILDIQKEEKMKMQEIANEAERSADQLMESERLRALALLEEREKHRMKEQRKGASVVVDQIRENEKKHLIEQENVAKERLHLLRKLEEEKKVDERRMEQLREQQKQELAAALASNEQVAAQRKQVQMANKIEDLKLLEYQRMLDMKQKEREEEQQAEAARREAEIAKLRSKQERAKDRASEIDALRAKRAIESAERAAREKDRKEQERISRMNASLAEARRVQQAERQLMLIQRAREEKQEFDRLVAVQNQQEIRELQRAQDEQSRCAAHAAELKQQIEAAREKNLQVRQDFLEEGNMLRAQLAAEQDRLKLIKTQKLDLLVKAGVPEKHCMNLKKLTV